MVTKKDFAIGQKVTTPEGPGVISGIRGNHIAVKLATGKMLDFSKDKITDDSDAG